MTPSPRRVLFLILAAALAACEPPSTPLAMQPGNVVHASLERGGIRRFAFDLGAGEYAEIAVSQENFDAILELSGGDLRPPLPLDTLTGAPVPEYARIDAPRSARFVLAIRSAGAGEGPFTVTIQARRKAGVRDRLAARADERLARAEAIRRQGPGGKEDDRALGCYAEAIHLYHRLGDSDRAAYGELLRARVLRRAGRSVEAAAASRRAIDGAPAEVEPELRARAAKDLSDQLAALGADAEADRWGQESIDLWRHLGAEEKRAVGLNEMAHRAAERGELARAEGLYREALAIWQRAGDRESVAIVEGNLASVYLLAGEAQLAFDSTERGVALLPPNAEAAVRADVLEQQGSALERLGREREAVGVLSEALALREKAGDRAAIARAEGRLARLAYESGRFAEAANRYRQALSEAEVARDERAALPLRQGLAWAELKGGGLAEAERLFKDLVSRAEAADRPSLQAGALGGLARIERSRGRLDRALAQVRRALGLVEGLRTEAGRGDLGRSVFADWQSFFDLAVEMLLARHAETGDPALLAEAFGVSERAKARRLLDLVRAPSLGTAGTAPLPVTAGVQVSVEAAEERLRVLEAAGSAPEEREAARRAVRQAVLEVRQQDGGDDRQVRSATPASLAEIQRRLGAESALLEFDLGETASALWIVTSHDLVLRRLPPRAEIEAQAGRALVALSAPGTVSESDRAQSALLATSRLLLGEAQPALLAGRWHVVADGALLALPLGALPDPEHPERPLLATREVAYAPSASVAVRLAERLTERLTEGGADRSKRGGAGSRGLAMIADAVYSVRDSRLGKATRAAAPPGALDLVRLRFSHDEGEAILALVPPRDRLDLRSFGADKATVLSGALEGYRYLHFAVHGLPDEEHPELSALALSVVDPAGRPRDGLLRSYEIARLALPADLTVLSACKSGQGTRIAGEGLVGLTQAFFTAGTERVVASLWQVDDEATATLMRRFYQGLFREGLSAPQALRRAQLSLAAGSSWRRPYYWAGFVVQGGF